MALIIAGSDALCVSSMIVAVCVGVWMAFMFSIFGKGLNVSRCLGLISISKKLRIHKAASVFEIMPLLMVLSRN